MDKAIKRHILKKRILLAKRSDEPMTFTERAPKFFKWFEEDVMGFDSEEYRKEFWREAYKHGRTIGHVPHTLNDHLQSRGRRSEAAIIEALCIALLMGGAFAIWVMRRKIDQHLHHLRRPSYYETERARRLGLTEQRRRIRQRTTINTRPDAGQLREAFIHARDSVGNMIRLGSLMEDLECYIDNSLIFGEDGKIVARKGGIRRYIQSEIPDLYKSYKTLMRYKALARRFRQAVGISDPLPAASVLPEEDSLPSKENMDVRTRVAAREKVDVSAEVKNRSIEKENAEKDICGGKHAEQKRVENMVRTNSHGGAGGSDGDRADGCSGGGKSSENECKRENRGVGGNEGIDGNEGKRENEGISGNEKDGNRAVDGRNGENHRLNDEVRRVVGEILDVCEGTFLNLSAVLALRICEDTIPHKCYRGTCVGACA
jgi:hypothetical protein